MRVVVIEGPEPVVTWEEADAHLRLDGDAEQKPYVESLIASVTAHLDAPKGWLGIALGRQTLQARFSLLGQDSIVLPYGPVSELVTVKYLDAAGVEQTADNADFELLGNELVSAGAVWPWAGASSRREAGRVTYLTGYEEVPAPIKAAILMMVADLHRFRTTASDMNITATAIPMAATAEALLQPYRVYC